MGVGALANGQPVNGIVVAHDADDRLRYAIHSVLNVSLLLYEVTFRLAPAPAPALHSHTHSESAHDWA